MSICESTTKVSNTNIFILKHKTKNTNSFLLKIKILIKFNQHNSHT
ncbi:hypothetical protein CAXC1_80051 [Candidatus Xenohaliotis californiensis]|uniref:Uncharacterized protein n=1 Tax=Candidatus Xenohaliotis californiensis TaxID=84677 RepID=A0ABP0EUC0_9RICK|nr:hypothetical protein CAXC1_80051 [Candidatus Xenohaliotis californiensis]